MLRVRGLKKSFGSLQVLDGIDFDVLSGETVAVIGPSGSGKSTMLRCLIDLEKAQAGTITIDGSPLLENGKYVTEVRARAACEKMSMVFQSFNLFPHMKVIDNLTSAPIHVKKMPREKALAKARELLAKVNLSDKENMYPSSLSGGQKQRVAIARALMMEPELLLFDEPTSSLDPQLTAEVLSVMRKLSEDRMTMVVVTHEMGFAREAADKVLFMAESHIVEAGTTKEIFENPKNTLVRDFIQSIL
ncbi:MAG: amino acid ABC transporter ATP-binding protein [Clostridiaceae bacterium]|nr:amino acid ABC transporter ATP-binding protein [Clostridiaceae bacterium]